MTRGTTYALLKCKGTQAITPWIHQQQLSKQSIRYWDKVAYTSKTSWKQECLTNTSTIPQKDSQFEVLSLELWAFGPHNQIFTSPTSKPLIQSNIPVKMHRLHRKEQGNSVHLQAGLGRSADLLLACCLALAASRHDCCWFVEELGRIVDVSRILGVGLLVFVSVNKICFGDLFCCCPRGSVIKTQFRRMPSLGFCDIWHICPQNLNAQYSKPTQLS